MRPVRIVVPHVCRRSRQDRHLLR